MKEMKIIWKLLYVSGIAFLLTSCGNGAKKNTTETEGKAARKQAETVTSLKPDLQKAFQNPGLAKWETRMKKTYSHFSTVNFRKGEERSLTPHPPQQYTKEKWQAFKPYFIFSPDHSKAIDLYSYGIMPVDDSITVRTLEGGDPDSEVNLVRLPDKTKTRLLFAGPGTVFQQAEWLNDSVVIITGESDANEENIKRPVLWQVNIRSQAVTEFVYQDTGRHGP